MTMRNDDFSRRGFLRGMLGGAGVYLALPLMESLGRTAWAAEPTKGEASDGTPPLRQFILTVAGGTVIESWKPKAAGPLTTMPSILRPIEAYKNDVMILSGLSHNGRQEGGGNAHTHCGGLHLTGAHLLKHEGKVMTASISVDQAAAQAVGGDTVLPSLEIGEWGYSFNTDGKEVPYEKSPRQIFDRLFKGRSPSVPAWKRGKSAPSKASSAGGKPGASVVTDDRLIIDAVLEDAKDLRRRLGKADQARMDEYLATVQGLDRQIGKLDQRKNEQLADAGVPTKRGPSGLLIPDEAALKLDLRAVQAGYHVENRAECFRVMAALSVLALQTDSTRVVTMSFGDDGYLWDGVVTVAREFHHHTLEHQANADSIDQADPLAREGCRQIHEWYSVLFAEVLARMKSIDEAGTSLLDNSMLLYTSYMSHGGHGTKDYPVLLAGRGKGTLKPGRHIAYPMNTPVANLYLSMLQRMGAKRDSFGESTGALKDLV
jgi:Protein of unknown function (DUF1552)